MGGALMGLVLGLIETTYAWCLGSRCWRWLAPRRRVTATVTDRVATDRDGREHRHTDEETR